MNAANPDRSKRLLRLLGVLSDRQPHSTLDLIRKAKVCAISAAVSELRAAGHRIACKRTGSVWVYRMAS